MSYGNVCGLDEAGRGALAGPLVAAAVVLADEPDAIARRAAVPLRDGKLLSRSQRERLHAALVASGSLVVTRTVSVRLINRNNIGWANVRIFQRLVTAVSAGSYVVDGKLTIRVPGKSGLIRSVVDADATIPEVIFAGIAAKVTRDRIMMRLAARYPAFGWDRNCGYGTGDHIDAIMSSSPTPHHRQLFVTTALSHRQQTTTMRSPVPVP